MKREQLMNERSNILKIVIRLFVLSMMRFGLAVVFHQGSPSQASAQTEEDTTAPTVSSVAVTSATRDDDAAVQQASTHYGGPLRIVSARDLRRGGFRFGRSALDGLAVDPGASGGFPNRASDDVE